MTAGGSAGLEAERQLALASAHEAEALLARKRAENFRAASVSEKRTVEALAPLVTHGYHLVVDRKWPGSRTAQVDLVVVGPSGVFIVDSKFWHEVTVAAGHIFRGQADVTDEFDGLAELAWKTEAALAEVGLAPGEVHAVAVFTGKKGVSGTVNTVDLVGDADIARYIARRSGRLTPAMVDTVHRAALDFFPHVSAPAPVALTIREPVLESRQVELDIAELPSADEIRAELLDAMLAPPIEEWMAFLHPDQAKLVRRSFNRPSHIRGAAGTGKTVVGLHRAAYLARSRPRKVLVTTYVRTLPVVLGNLLKRMAPEVADRVEFVGVHALARSPPSCATASRRRPSPSASPWASTSSAWRSSTIVAVASRLWASPSEPRHPSCSRAIATRPPRGTPSMPDLAPGDVVWVASDAATGGEQSGRRPALVVAGADYLQLIDALAVVVPLTSVNRGWPNHIPVSGTSPPSASWAMTEQVRTISRDRIVGSAERADAETLRAVRGCVRDFLGT